VAAAQAILPSVVQVRTRQGSGLGLVMDDQGRVLTNHHEVAGSTTVSLALSTGRRVIADVIGSTAATTSPSSGPEAASADAYGVSWPGKVRLFGGTWEG
jgi:S1-C subfamily serine protease